MEKKTLENTLKEWIPYIKIVKKQSYNGRNIRRRTMKIVTIETSYGDSIALPNIKDISLLDYAIELESEDYKSKTFRIKDKPVKITIIDSEKIVAEGNTLATMERIKSLEEQLEAANKARQEAEVAKHREEVFVSKLQAAYSKGLTKEEWRAAVNTCQPWKLSSLEPSK